MHTQGSPPRPQMGGLFNGRIRNEMMEDIQILNHTESDGNCQLCGKEDDLRPYGPGGKWVCFDCGMKDEEEAIRQFNRILNKASTTVLEV